MLASRPSNCLMVEAMKPNSERMARTVIIGLAAVWVVKEIIASIHRHKPPDTLGLYFLEDVFRHLFSPESLAFWVVLCLLYLAFRLVRRLVRPRKAESESQQCRRIMYMRTMTIAEAEYILDIVEKALLSHGFGGF